MPGTEVKYELNLSPEIPEKFLDIAREQGEDPDITCQLIQELRDMIFEKGECTPPRTDDDFLIKFLRCRFWKVDNAYKLLCNYCNFRESNRELYEKVHPLDLLGLGDDKIVEVTPYRDQNGRRIVIIRFGKWDTSKFTVDDIFRATLIILEMGSLEPVAQVIGGIGIFDLGGLSFSHILQLTPSVAQKMIALMVTSMPIRTTAIHVVNQNWLFNAGFQIFKPFLNARMREGIHIHGNDWSSLHQHIHPDHLPESYGGVHPDYPYSQWLIGFKKCEQISRELEQLGYIVEPTEENNKEKIKETS